jgi:hypothetical protein
VFPSATGSDLVQPLALGLFGLVANPIAKSFGFRVLEKNGLAQLWLDRDLKNMG